MSAQFVTSDSEHDSEGASPIQTHQPQNTSNPLRKAYSTPGQIFNNNDNNTVSNPFDDFGDEDPFADDNPNNPFNNPFGNDNNSNKNQNQNQNQFNSNSNQFNSQQFNNPFISNKKKAKHAAANRRTDVSAEVKEKRSQTPEAQMPPLFNASNNPNNNNSSNAKSNQPSHRRHNSVPVNSFDPNINLDDIFADSIFNPQNKNKNQNQNQNQKRPSISRKQKQQAPKLPPKTGASLSLQASNTHSTDKKRSKSVFMARGPPQEIRSINTRNQNQNQNNNANKRRGSVNAKGDNDINNELDVAHKTGYDISYFIDKNIAYKYLCIICENVCRSAVELACKKKRHLCCSYCLRKYFDIHGNKCPIHPEHSNLKFSTSKYITYHIESLKVSCPYSTSNGIHSSCSWEGQLKLLDQHTIGHKKYIICPFNIYGCNNKIKIDEENKEENELSAEEILNAHLINNQHQHLILLLKKTRELSLKIEKKNCIIDKLIRTENKMCTEVSYLKKISRISDDNIWILCGSHKFWKHKYNQLFTVNLQNECRTQIRIYDISRLSNNKSISTNTDKSSTKTTHSTSGGNTQQYDPTQSDSWDVGDLGVAHINNRFEIPIWLQKKYPNLDCFNRERLNSIIFRCGGHLIRDKKVTSRVDAILLDNHYLSNANSGLHSNSNAIPMQQLIGYKLNCFPNLPTKRYNCECVYSQTHGLVVVGGSGIDKNQINYVNQLKIRDQDVNITYSNSNANNNNDDQKNNANKYDKKYPMNNTFNITLEWKSLSPILRAREDTAMCLFNDKKIYSKEYIIICGGWSNGCLRTSELYNFDVNKWINLPPMNVKHNAAGIAEWKNKNSIVICGGFNTEAHFACEYFELIKQKWIKLPNTNYKHRYKPAVWIKNVNQPQVICCAGSGVLKNEVGTVEYLDTRDNKWSTVKKPLASLLGLGANINANNWRMWRIFT